MAVNMAMKTKMETTRVILIEHQKPDPPLYPTGLRPGAGKEPSLKTDKESYTITLINIKLQRVPFASSG